MPVPVVTTTKGASLADHLDLRNLPLATTPGGRNFVIKALHPADHEIKVARGPGCTMPTVGIAADAVQTLHFPENATDAYILQTANPVAPLSVVFTDPSGIYVDHYLWLNQALGFGGFIRRPDQDCLLPMVEMIKQVSSYRVLSQSVTVEVIAPMIKDQGTIVSAQMNVKPRTMSLAAGTTSGISAGADLWWYRDPPPASSLLMATNSYTGKARDGFYQPLKLDRFKFISPIDVVLQKNGGFPVTYAWTANSNLGNFPTYWNNLAIPEGSPYPPKPSTYGVGMTWIQGTAGYPDVTLRVRARQTLEVIPVIGSTYAPLAEAPFPPDELAYRMVAEIGGRMKDAYPASYNDLGKLKDTIMKIGRSVIKYADPVLDVVSAIPGAGTVVGGVRTALRTGKAIGKALDSMSSPNRSSSGASGNRSQKSPAKRAKKKKKQRTRAGPEPE